MPALHSIVYVSTAIRPFSTGELRALLARSRAQNERTGITGTLLYKDGCFMQAFEGPPHAVWQLHDRIAGDPRHRNVIVLLDGPVARREFPDWSMGFRELTDGDLQDVPAYDEMLRILSQLAGFSTDPSLAKRLLLSFTAHPV